VKAGSGHVAIVLLAGTAFVFLAPRPGPAAKPRPPSESERIKALPDEERQWLTEFVAPIILDEEKKSFLDLEAPYQREVFKREFWERRELPDLPSPLGPGYRFGMRSCVSSRTKSTMAGARTRVGWSCDGASRPRS